MLKLGKSFTILFFWLNNVELAKERVKTRVWEGGHNIPTKLIERRYSRGILNLFDIYLEIVDGTFIFDNSFGKHELIASKFEHEQILVLNKSKFAILKNQYHDEKRKTN